MPRKLLHEKHNYLDSVSLFGRKLWVKLSASFSYKIVVFEIYSSKHVSSTCVTYITNSL